ncbi:unnamed protein product [Closterium sp. Yama58-4]|nr:unnamed protein product [Closterium sp. Yama58-4]
MAALVAGAKVRTWIRELGFIWRTNQKGGSGAQHSLRLVARRGPKQERGEGFMGRIEVDGIAVPRLGLGDELSLFEGEGTVTYARQERSGNYDVDVYSVKLAGLLEAEVRLRPAHPLLQEEEDAEVHLRLDLGSIRHSASVHGVVGQAYRDEGSSRCVCSRMAASAASAASSFCPCAHAHVDGASRLSSLSTLKALQEHSQGSLRKFPSAVSVNTLEVKPKGLQGSRKRLAHLRLSAVRATSASSIPSGGSFGAANRSDANRSVSPQHLPSKLTSASPWQQTCQQRDEFPSRKNNLAAKDAIATSGPVSSPEDFDLTARGEEKSGSSSSTGNGEDFISLPEGMASRTRDGVLAARVFHMQLGKPVVRNSPPLNPSFPGPNQRSVAQALRILRDMLAEAGRKEGEDTRSGLNFRITGGEGFRGEGGYKRGVGERNGQEEAERGLGGEGIRGRESSAGVQGARRSVMDELINSFGINSNEVSSKEVAKGAAMHVEPTEGAYSEGQVAGLASKGIDRSRGGRLSDGEEQVGERGSVEGSDGARVSREVGERGSAERSERVSVSGEVGEEGKVVVAGGRRWRREGGVWSVEEVGVGKEGAGGEAEEGKGLAGKESEERRGDGVTGAVAAGTVAKGTVTAFSKSRFKSAGSKAAAAAAVKSKTGISGAEKREHRRTSKAERKAAREAAANASAPTRAEIIEVGKAGIAVKDLAGLLAVGEGDIVRALFMKGVITNVNQVLNEDMVAVVCEEYGVEVLGPQEGGVEESARKVREFVEEEDREHLMPRPPVVTVMGHVDHGKTSLLDYIRHTKTKVRSTVRFPRQVLAITSGLQRNESKGSKGDRHSSGGGGNRRWGHAPPSLPCPLSPNCPYPFSAMRARGARVTDIAVVVVAADDRVMPQTTEAIAHACNLISRPFPLTPSFHPQAFSAMRARGARVTDIAVVVVAADDGVMPQTTEAIAHARAANVPMLIAINKIDREGASVERVKQQLGQAGVLPEEWGGDTPMVPIQELRANPSRLAVGTVIEARLDRHRGPVATLLVQMMVMIQELQANPNRPAVGTVIEARLDRHRGPVATLLVQNGTLKLGDIVVCGEAYGKVRALLNDSGMKTKAAGPSAAVQVEGLSCMPVAGDEFHVLPCIHAAREMAEEAAEKARADRLAAMQGEAKVTLSAFATAVGAGGAAAAAAGAGAGAAACAGTSGAAGAGRGAGEERQEGEEVELHVVNVVLKVDCQGSVEAIREALSALPQDTVSLRFLLQVRKGGVRVWVGKRVGNREEEVELHVVNVVLKVDCQGSVEAIREALSALPQDTVSLRFLLQAPGDVSSSDVDLAASSSAVVLAFNVGVSPAVAAVAEMRGVRVRSYRVIYDVVEEVRAIMEGLLHTVEESSFLGRAEVRAVFGTGSTRVAGVMVTEGRLQKGCTIVVTRGGRRGGGGDGRGGGAVPMAAAEQEKGNNVKGKREKAGEALGLKKQQQQQQQQKLEGRWVHSGQVTSLRRVKEHVGEVVSGLECGVGVEGFNGWQQGDFIEAYEVTHRARTLEDASEEIARVVEGKRGTLGRDSF